MLLSLFTVLALGASTIAHPLLEKRADGCNADNVLRLLRATQRLDDSIAFCSDFLGLPVITESAMPSPTASVTITEFRTATVTETFVQTETAVQFDKLKKRCTDDPSHTDATTTTKSISTPGFILSTSIDPSRLSSACGCLTIPLSTLTVTATDVPATVSVSVTQTETVVSVIYKTETTTINAPSLALATPTSVFQFPIDKPATFSLDDPYYRVEFDFEVEVYGFKSNLIFVSVNGLIWLDEFAEGNYWYYFTDGDVNGADLPLEPLALPDIAILPFWTDMFVNGGQVQGIWYEVSGSAGSKSVTFEYLASAYGSTDNDYHFTVTLSEGSNKVSVHYLNVLDSTAGTAAVQHYSGNEALVFSRYDSKVTNGLTLEFDTSAGTINQS
ncbi:hypothetical protein H072_5630 [Dactylellina haptotyla CBS 200.50]|uniref:Uncharacterized protein n=1 Tax=Dactylellina haptotyla (strain CBS 200.50) TaxID=1284197 RepID=S8AH53_DACHA|nr:hypothetical protein H072_5630 [Dactylellina haptotyla CBS 200.50]